jgi:hypothetical protein
MADSEPNGTSFSRSWTHPPSTIDTERSSLGETGTNSGIETHINTTLLLNQRVANGRGNSLLISVGKQEYFQVPV